MLNFVTLLNKAVLKLVNFDGQPKVQPIVQACLKIIYNATNIENSSQRRN